ncbi:hypothetical protein BC936DRAFT_146951 [Jimgerdemannia flammicorona]|nr:hypothetical protein BC936DRAFT_146951 [Jimgerdemannia flammicorona]
MNSTTTPLDSVPFDVSTVASIWASLVFSVLSCVVIGRKAIIDYCHLRVSCFAVGVLTGVGMATINIFRLQSDISEDNFFVVKSVLMVVFMDLLFVMIFNLGRKLYEWEDGPVNRLSKLSLALAVLMNVLGAVSLIVGQVFHFHAAGDSIYTASIFVALSTMSVVVIYALYPVTKIKTGVDKMPSKTVAVGIWYLSGIIILGIVSILSNVISTIYPRHTYKSVDMNIGTTVVFLR